MPKPTRLDLRGTSCPMNFIKIKIFLEQHGMGYSVLAVVDSDPVATDISESLKSQGFHVLTRIDKDEYSELTVCHERDYP